jgi:hypothetical protein
MAKNYTYYILDNDGEIALYDTDKTRLENTLRVTPQYPEQKVKSTTKEIVLLDGKPVFADEHTEEINEQKEIEQKKAEEQETAQTVATLKADMLTAIALNDEEWLADLRAEYVELTGE